MQLQLYVDGYPDSDSRERAELAQGVRRDLLELDVEQVAMPSAAAPEDAKGSAVEWAQLVVTLAGTLPPVIAALQSWLRRHPGASLTVEIDGDRITLTEASARERRELIDAWLHRHARE